MYVCMCVQYVCLYVQYVCMFPSSCKNDYLLVVLQRSPAGRSHFGRSSEEDPQQHSGDAGPDDERHYAHLRLTPASSSSLALSTDTYLLNGTI